MLRLRGMRRLTLALVIVVMLVAIGEAIPDILDTLDRRRQNQTMANMRTIATSLEAWATDAKSYNFGPARPLPVGEFHAVSHAELERALVPTYVRKLPRLDGWGQPILVYVGGYDDKGRAQHYAVRSFGSDRRPDEHRYARGTITRYSADIVFSDGHFVRHPPGMCG
jgi:hypothetical protein